MSRVSQNFHKEVEAGINKQINKELASSYFHLSIAFHFDRDDVALENFQKYFAKLSQQKKDNADKCLKYMNERGGRISLKDIPTPDNNLGTPHEVMKAVLAHEKVMNTYVLELTALAEKHGDENFADFMEDNFLETQVDRLKEVGGHVRNLERAGTGLGEYMFDQETLGGDH